MNGFKIDDLVICTNPRIGWEHFRGMEGIVIRPHHSIHEAMYIRVTKASVHTTIFGLGHEVAVYSDQFDHNGGPW